MFICIAKCDVVNNYGAHHCTCNSPSEMSKKYIHGCPVGNSPIWKVIDPELEKLRAENTQLRAELAKSQHKEQITVRMSKYYNIPTQVVFTFHNGYAQYGKIEDEKEEE